MTKDRKKWRAKIGTKDGGKKKKTVINIKSGLSP